MRSDCQPIREVMDSYLSDELLVETNHELLRHIEHCTECAAELERRERLRRLMQDTLRSDVSSGSLEARIVARIEARQRWRGMGLGAVVGLAVLSGVFLLTPHLRSTLDVTAFADSFADHRECALTFPPGATLDMTRVERRLRPPYFGLVSAVREAGGPYTLIDGHPCPYQGRSFTHLVLRDREHTLSLFVAPRTKGGLPTEEARGGELEATGRETRDHLVVLVSNLPAAEHQMEALRLLPSAAEFLKTLEGSESVLPPPRSRSTTTIGN